MTGKTPQWKKGRGKLGVLDPVLGTWEATGDSPMGKMKCTRTFSKLLDGHYVQLIAKWEFTGKLYEEVAIIGMDGDRLSFWSFTSDGKKSQGYLADGTDVHAQAICFEAEMPAGTARMLYWPGQGDSFHWAVESKNKKGWRRFTEHHYNRIAG